MDRMIYTAMSGAKYLMERQADNAHNLANVNTTGFRAELHRFRAVPVQSDAMPTRAFVVDASVGSDFSPGAIQHTGRALDAAIQGSGWFAVQAADGTEAYTRNGNFKLTAEGQLQTNDGQPVMGEGGPISLPPNVEFTIGKDGTISAVPSSGSVNVVNILERLKLVNPPEAELDRGADGLYRVRSGQPAQPDPSVVVAGGALEGSNVSPVESLVTMISLARQFEMQVKLMQDAEKNSQQADTLLSLSR